MTTATNGGGRDDRAVMPATAARRSAHEWIDADPDPATRDELDHLLSERPGDIGQRFASRLRFGTAGLRGELGAGPTRMNRVLVRVAATALGAGAGRQGRGRRGAW